jgi:hypothetical protein
MKETSDYLTQQMEIQNLGYTNSENMYNMMSVNIQANVSMQTTTQRLINDIEVT